MHPVEHLYYFTSVGPSLFLFASPFTFIWNGLHLIISPAAGHSGWEDHFQSNQFHYLHHRYFSKLVMDCVSKSLRFLAKGILRKMGDNAEIIKV